MPDRRARTPDTSPHLRTYAIRSAAELRDYARTHAFDSPFIADPSSPQEGTFRTGNRQIEYLFVPPDARDGEAVEHTLAGPPNATRRILIAPHIAGTAHIADFHLFADQITGREDSITEVCLNSSDRQGTYAKVVKVGPHVALHLGPYTLTDIRFSGGIITAHNATLHINTLRSDAQTHVHDGTKLTIRHLEAGACVSLSGNSNLYLPNGWESAEKITFMNDESSIPILYLPADKLPPGFNHRAYPNVVVLSDSISHRAGEEPDDFKQKGMASDGTVRWVPLHRIDHKKTVAFELA